MRKIHSALLIAGFVLLPALLFAQFNNNTTSPFSRFGLGDLQPYNFGRSTAMGGATIGSRNAQQINVANPASYTSGDSLAFLFEFGLSGKFSSYKNDIGKFDTDDVNFRYFALSFPITRWMGTSLGLTPYSDVGYDLLVNEDIDNTGAVRYRYYGDGSLSRAYWGLAVKPFKNISIGYNFYYFFGNLSRNAYVHFPDYGDLYVIEKIEEIRMRDFGYNLGLQVTLPMKKQQSLTLGVTVENKPKFTAFNSDISLKRLYISTGGSTGYTDVDTISYVNEVKDIIQLPLNVGVGLSYVKKNVLEVNADYCYQGWAKARFFGDTNPLLTNRELFSAGAEWIPEKYSIKSYWKKVAYRAGMRYEGSYLTINNQQIKDVGISFGVGLPVYRSNSTVNLSAEIGKRGSTKNNLIRENYAKFNLSVNLYDLWFIKRQFD